MSYTQDLAYTYDNNGNILSGAGRTFTWTVDNRMDVVNGPGGSAIMSYDYTGIRVKKSGTAGTTYFPFTGYEVQGLTVTKYIKIGNEIIASKKDGVGKLFYHNDHLGGVNVITDDSVNPVKVQLNEYDPWGKISRSDGLADPNHRFTGQELDPESDIHYYVGRYYDQNLGRFISPDPFVQDPDDPQNLNRYAYVVNGPQNYIDPSGYFSFLSIFAFAASAFSNILAPTPFPVDFLQNFRADLLDGVLQLEAVSAGAGAAAAGAGAALGGTAASTGALLQTGLGTVGAIGAAVAVGAACAGPMGLACGAATLGFMFSADQAATGIRSSLSGQAQQSSVEGAIQSFGASPGQSAFIAAGIGAIASPGSGTRQLSGAFSRVLGFTERSLQKGFMKHGKAFGLSGNWNPSRAADFSSAVNQHINAPGTRIIQGTYRGDPGTHYLNPNTGLNVFADPAGNYVSGWQLGPDQLKSVLATGRLF